MGTYLNPGNSGFVEIIKSDYVDKTELIGLINNTIGTKKKLTCISRPRRFGKSYAAQMLCAYYDKTCESHELFADYKIAKDPSYETHIQKDTTGFISEAKKEGVPLSEIPAAISAALRYDIKTQYPNLELGATLNDTFINLVNSTETKIIFIIDEWDAIIRESPDDNTAQDRYFNLLRGWFKNNSFTPKVVAAAYITGILPIKKDGSQSAISDFKEYTMIKPRDFGEYVGFTENEVNELCDEHGMDFDLMKQWHDGYEFKGVGAVYNPNSVMQAIDNDDFDSYWTESSAAEGLMEYISKDYNGLTKTIAELIGGVNVKVNTTGFANDLVTFKGKAMPILYIFPNMNPIGRLW